MRQDKGLLGERTIPELLLRVQGDVKLHFPRLAASQHASRPVPEHFQGQTAAREGWGRRVEWERRKNVAKLVGAGIQSGPRIAFYRHVFLFLVLPRLPAIIFHIHYIYILVLRPPQWMRFRIPVNVSHCHILTAWRRALTRHIRPDSPRWDR